MLVRQLTKRVAPIINLLELLVDVYVLQLDLLSAVF